MNVRWTETAIESSSQIPPLVAFGCDQALPPDQVMQRGHSVGFGHGVFVLSAWLRDSLGYPWLGNEQEVMVLHRGDVDQKTWRLAHFVPHFFEAVVRMLTSLWTAFVGHLFEVAECPVSWKRGDVLVALACVDREIYQAEDLVDYEARKGDEENEAERISER